MNAAKIVQALAQQDRPAALAAGNEALREVMLGWLCDLHRNATMRAEHMREELFGELERQAPHIEHEAAVRVVDFIYGLQANTRSALAVLRKMVEDAEAAQPPQPQEGQA